MRIRHARVSTHDQNLDLQVQALKHVRLQGRILSHDGDERYTFADASGRLTVEISADRFPSGKPISEDQRVELVGEVDKDWGRLEFEAQQVLLLP